MDPSFSQTNAVVEQEGNPETGHYESNVGTLTRQLEVSLMKIGVPSCPPPSEMRLKKRMEIKYKVDSHGYMGKQRVWSKKDDDFKLWSRYGVAMAVYEQLVCS